MDFKRYVNLSYALVNQKAHRCFHTSFIVRKGKILAIGINQIKTHPKIRAYGYHSLCGLHSELDAALKLGLTDCSNLTLVNIRIDGQNKVNMSKPCRFCQRLIRDLNFKQVFYSNEHGEFEKYEY